VRSTEDARHPDPEIVVVAEREGRLEVEAANGDRAADERCFTAPYPRAYRTAVRQSVSDAEPGDTLRVRDRIEVVDRAKSVQPLERTDAYRSGTEDVRAQRVTRQAPCCHAACDSDPPEIERDGRARSTECDGPDVGSIRVGPRALATGESAQSDRRGAVRSRVLRERYGCAANPALDFVRLEHVDEAAAIAGLEADHAILVLLCRAETHAERPLRARVRRGVGCLLHRDQQCSRRH